MIVLSLLTLLGLGVIFLAAFMRLWQNPPVLTINLTGLKIPEIPTALALTLQHVPAEAEMKPREEPIPEDILDYILAESDSWAQDARMRRARELQRETGSWDAAFRLMQKEDSA